MSVAERMTADRYLAMAEKDPRRGLQLIAAAPSFDVSLKPGPGESLSSPLLPGFELALDELFPG